MAIALVGLGSNLGDRQARLSRAVDELRRFPQTTLLALSPWLENPAVGGPPQGPFLNGVAQMETRLAPRLLLERLQETERRLGRLPGGVRWGPRIIDLDLLSYGDLLLDEPGLTLPHPRLHERRFVLAPLAAIAPGWRHPRFGTTAAELLRRLDDADRPHPPPPAPAARARS